MTSKLIASIYGSSARAQSTILGAAVVICLGACAAPPITDAPMVQSEQKNFSTEPPVGRAQVEVEAETEPKELPAPIDPGAAMVVEQIASAIENERTGEGTVRIGVWQLRNRSRCHEREFQSLLDRIAGQFTRAGDEAKVVFTSEASADVQYHLLGSAYVVTAEGFDLWEIFLMLSPAENSWTVWSAPGPVTVLRQARPGQPQVFLSHNW